MADEARTTTFCRCDERQSAHIANRFTYSHDYKAWYFPFDLKRQRTWRAKYYETEDHSGEPYLFWDCPWCGNVLPGMQEPIEQADGN